MLYPLRVFRALKGNALRQLRILSGIKARPKAPVLQQEFGEILARHERLCRQFLQLLPQDLSLSGANVCEAGAGDCLAVAALAMGLGAARAEIVELEPPVVNEKQIAVLAELAKRGFPIDDSIFERSGGTVRLNASRVGYHTLFMDDYTSERLHRLIYSFCVLEHVENLGAFLRSCFRATVRGGMNIHMFDLGGHGEFEDPIPPLDFQTYPDLLYRMMYPRFHRATRRFLSEYITEFEKAGFTICEVTPLRVETEDYLASIKTRLCAKARKIPDNELRIIEVAVTAKRPE